MRLVFALALAVALGTGCASMYGGMSAEQINAAAKDKSATAVCSKIIGAGFSAETYVIALDNKVIHNGSVSVGEKCALNVTDEATVKVPVVAPASVALSLDSNGNCVRTVFDAGGHPTGSSTVDRARCQ